MKKIYPADLLALRPYRNANQVDLYYVRVANEIKQILIDFEWNEEFYNDEELTVLSLYLVGWFEDVISELGIWQTFTAECKRIYGSYLPFYNTTDDYYPDEINIADIQFLLWHFMQQDYAGEKFVNPENDFLLEMAEVLYDLFDDEFEQALINERLYKYIHETLFDAESFYTYRERLEWFELKCYFGYSAALNMQDRLAECAENLSDQDLSEDNLFKYLYDTRVEHLISSRSNLLSYTTPEWVALFCSDHPQAELMRNFSFSKRFEYLLYQHDDSNYVYCLNLCDNDKPILIDKRSLNLPHRRELIAGDTVLLCKLVKYNGHYWHNGSMVLLSLDEKLRPMIAEEINERERQMHDPEVERCLKEMNGIPFKFFSSRAELQQFFARTSVSNNKQLLEESVAEGPLMLACEHRAGIKVWSKYFECIKSPDNPYYDQSTATEFGASYFIHPSFGYELSCYLQEHDLLPDAYLESDFGIEYGREFLHKHGQFIIDYCFGCRREKDYDPYWKRNLS